MDLSVFLFSLIVGPGLERDPFARSFVPWSFLFQSFQPRFVPFFVLLIKNDSRSSSHHTKFSSFVLIPIVPSPLCSYSNRSITGMFLFQSFHQCYVPIPIVPSPLCSYSNSSITGMFLFQSFHHRYVLIPIVPSTLCSLLLDEERFKSLKNSF